MAKERTGDSTHKRISYKNVDRIMDIGKMGDSFDDVISRVLDYWEDGHKKGDVFLKGKGLTHDLIDSVHDSVFPPR
jgi:hypothetical protein